MTNGIRRQLLFSRQPATAGWRGKKRRKQRGLVHSDDFRRQDRIKLWRLKASIQVCRDVDDLTGCATWQDRQGAFPTVIRKLQERFCNSRNARRISSDSPYFCELLHTLRRHTHKSFLKLILVSDCQHRKFWNDRAENVRTGSQLFGWVSF